MTWIRAHKWPLAWVVISVLFVVLVYRTQTTSEKAQDTANENTELLVKVAKLTHVVATNQRATTAGLIQSCRQNGNPLRKAVRKQIQKGITNVNDPRLAELLPTTDPAVVAKIVHEGNREARIELEEIQNVSCAKQYR